MKEDAWPLHKLGCVSVGKLALDQISSVISWAVPESALDHGTIFQAVHSSPQLTFQYWHASVLSSVCVQGHTPITKLTSECDLTVPQVLHAGCFSENTKLQRCLKQIGFSD